MPYLPGDMSSHGLTLARKNHYLAGRIAWFTLFLISTMWLLSMLVRLILEYRLEETLYKIEIGEKPYVPVPTVTICSSNPYRKQQVNKIPSLAAMLQAYDEVVEDITQNSSSTDERKNLIQKTSNQNYTTPDEGSNDRDRTSSTTLARKERHRRAAAPAPNSPPRLDDNGRIYVLGDTRSDCNKACQIVNAKCDMNDLDSMQTEDKKKALMVALFEMTMTVGPSLQYDVTASLETDPAVDMSKFRIRQYTIRGYGTGKDRSCDGSSPMMRRFCQCKDIDECESNPCKNGATCHDGNKAFTCTCYSGYAGDQCENDIDECDVNGEGPCKNGGTCENMDGTFQCKCSPNYTGSSCEEEVGSSVTLSGKSKGKGGRPLIPDIASTTAVLTTTTTQSTFSATVTATTIITTTTATTAKTTPTSTATLTSPRATTMSPELLPVSKPEGSMPSTETDTMMPPKSTLLQTSGTTSAPRATTMSPSVPHVFTTRKPTTTTNAAQNNVLSTLFTTTTMHLTTLQPNAVPKGNCSSQSCVNGHCTATGDCVCYAGWNGVKCDTDIDDCASYPCKNGGTCEDLAASFDCKCKTGYTGAYCEQDIDECASNPCKSEETCADGANGYACFGRPAVIDAKTYVSAMQKAYKNNKNDSSPTENANSVDAAFRESLAAFVESMPKEKREKLLNTAENLFSICSFNGIKQPCSRLFTEVYSYPGFGNCFVFNNITNQRRELERAGHEYGLKLWLKLDQDSYLPFTSSAGLRLLLSTPGQPVFPDITGYSLPAGHATFFAMRYNNVSRLLNKKGHNKCSSSAAELKDYYYYGAYSTTGCQNSKLQQIIMRNCGCAYTMLQYPPGSTICTTTEQLSCVLDKVANNKTSDINCPPPCWEEILSVTSTQLTWPGNNAIVS